jgi:hypothetical protein
MRNTRISTIARNAELDALANLLSGGYVRIYAGGQPDNPESAATADLLLAELRFEVPAFKASKGGEIESFPLADDSSARSTGLATWCRMVKADGKTVVLDGSVGAIDANVVMNAPNIQAGARVSITSLKVTQPMQGT